MEVYKIVNECDDAWYGDYPDFDIIHGNIMCGRDVDVFVADIPEEKITNSQEEVDCSLLEDIDDTIDWKDYEHYSA